MEKGNNYTMIIDLMKAYDLVRQNFILKVLEVMGFPSSMIKWIKACISSLKFSVCINGELVGFFGRSKGIRQKDLLSPYLFMMVMKALFGLLN